MRETETLEVFLAGIMQGSLPDALHSQSYRGEIAALIREHLPGAEVFDPFAAHPESLGYDPERGRDVFFGLMEKAGQIDVLIAFLPEASMGTAIEMWSAYHAGAVIVTVSPLEENWVVRFLSDAVVPDLPAFQAFLREGRLEGLLARKVGYGETAGE